MIFWFQSYVHGSMKWQRQITSLNQHLQILSNPILAIKALPWGFTISPAFLAAIANRINIHSKRLVSTRNPGDFYQCAIYSAVGQPWSKSCFILINNLRTTRLHGILETIHPTSHPRCQDNGFDTPGIRFSRIDLSKTFHSRLNEKIVSKHGSPATEKT